YAEFPRCKELLALVFMHTNVFFPEIVGIDLRIGRIVEVRRLARFGGGDMEDTAEKNGQDLSGQAEQALNVILGDVLFQWLARILEDHNIKAVGLSQVRIIEELGD